MKRLLSPAPVLAALILAAGSAGADADALTVELRPNEAGTLELDFVPASFLPVSGKGLVKADVFPGLATVSLVAGARPGSAQFRFMDASGTSVALVTAVVVSELDSVHASLVRELDESFPGLRAEKGSRVVVVKGTVTSEAKWNALRDLLASGEYAGLVESRVRFGADAGTVSRLRAALAKAGLSVAEPDAEPGPGQIAVAYAKEENELSVSGQVWTKAELDAIGDVLGRQSWLAAPGDASPDAEKKVRTVLSVSLDRSPLEMSVAVLSVDKTKSREIGSDMAPTVAAAFKGFYNFLTGEHASEVFRLDIDFATTVRAIAGAGASRNSMKAVFTFLANDETPQTAHFGSSLTVTPVSSGDGSAGDKEKYELGLVLVSNGTKPISADEAEIHLDFTYNGPVESKYVGMPGGGAVETGHSVHKLPSLVRNCRYGRTIAVAGYEKIVKNDTEPEGLPLLRHIPVINWFVAKESHFDEKLTMVILVSIRKIGDDEAPREGIGPIDDISGDMDKPYQKILDPEKGTAGRPDERSLVDWFRW
ncbi:MAG: hypothetical protein IJV65_02485 [Kiritimatiellae bacterium]|nr:hypothetical protein [Kiritimatiellia bacterium]